MILVQLVIGICFVVCVVAMVPVCVDIFLLLIINPEKYKEYGVDNENLIELFRLFCFIIPFLGGSIWACIEFNIF